MQYREGNRSTLRGFAFFLFCDDAPERLKEHVERTALRSEIKTYNLLLWRVVCYVIHGPEDQIAEARAIVDPDPDAID